MKRYPGDEAALLGEVIRRAKIMLTRYGLKLTHTVNIEDNSYTVDVLPDGLDHVGVVMRLQRHDELQAVLREIVFADDSTARELALQRAGCLLDPRLPRLLECIDTKHPEVWRRSSDPF